MKLILILLLTMSQAFAIDVTSIKKGAPAPTDGFFVTVESMKEIRQINEEKKLLTRENLKLRDLIVIKEDTIALYKQRYEAAETELSWEQTKGNFKGIGGFVVGAIATTAAAFAAAKLIRR